MNFMRKYRLFAMTLGIVVFLIACNKDEKKTEIINVPDVNFPAKIDSLSSKTFEYGDTITIYGQNFGTEQGSNYVIIGEQIVDEKKYIDWQNTEIKVIVPEDIESGSISINNKYSNSLAFTIKTPFLIRMVNHFVDISLFATFIFIYLQINKIWKRKHEQEVADSQSLAGLSIYVLNCILWVAYYLILGDFRSTIDTTFYVFQGSILFMIGTGIFVRGQRAQGVWHLIKRSLKLERTEADYLIKRFFRPANADKILSMLHQLAMIDEDLDPKEQELLESFAREWNIDYNVDKFNKERKVGTQHNYMLLRKNLKDYLDVYPPHEQVAQLRDMMEAIIKADEKVTDEEDLIQSELMGLISNYLDKEDSQEHYNVLIVPQKPDHEELIKQLLPESEKMKISGGEAYLIGTYYSITYAEMICKQYQKYNIFTIVLTPEESKEAKKIETRHNEFSSKDGIIQNEKNM